MKSWKPVLAAAAVTVAVLPVLHAESASAQVLDSLKQRTQRQRPQQQPPAQPPATGQPGAPQRTYNLSRDEQAAVTPALQAAERSDWAATQAALPAAAAAARGADAKYVVGQIRLRLGIGLNDQAIQSQAIDELIASGGAQPSEMKGLLENQLQFATAAGNTAKAARAQAALDALNPNDPLRFLRQAQTRAAARDFAGAIGLYQQAMQQVQSSGQPVPPEWRRTIAGLAYQGRLPQASAYMREWLVATPSPQAWHDNLVVLSELGAANAALKLDIYRLMRAAGAMQNERDYIELGQAAGEARLIGEVQAVYQEGLSRNLITTNAAFARERLQAAAARATEDRASLAGERTAALAGSDGAAALRLGDAYYGYGDYRAAAELYRAAAGKSGVDAATVNTRLGAALALAGDRAGAEAAFRAVSGGSRGELAQLWLLWLSQRGA